MQKIKENKLIIVFFILLFSLGLFTFKDYGLSNDEAIQRQHLIVNHYEYVKLIKKITGIELNSIKNLYVYYGGHLELKNINKYEHKYYGVGIQLPFALLEQITSFKLDISTMYHLKHLYTFLIYFISTIYFFLILNKYILKDKNYALIGTIFLVLSPRIYGDSFYNIKDSVFTSLCIINCYYCLKFLENKQSNKDIIKLSIITALTINSRIAGGLIIFLCLVIKIISNRKELKKILSSILKVIIFTYIFYFLITPGMWYDPILFPYKALKYFYNYKDITHSYIQTNYYFGHWIQSNKMPWHYILVWIFITTPITYIILFIINIIKNIYMFAKNKFKITNKNLLFLNLILFIIILICVILKPTLYGGWRHIYFIYPIIIVNSILGLKFIINKLSKIKIFIKIIVYLNLACVLIWMIKSHPYQYNYFNFIFRDYYISNFQFNYWMIPNSDALKYIAKIDKRKNIIVENDYNINCKNILEKKDRDRITLVSPIFNSFVDEKTKYDYIITDMYNTENIPKDYKKIKTKKQDGYSIYNIYKHK